jgi:hypothetical protein
MKAPLRFKALAITAMVIEPVINGIENTYDKVSYRYHSNVNMLVAGKLTDELQEAVESCESCKTAEDTCYFMGNPHPICASHRASYQAIRKMHKSAWDEP